MIKSFLIIISLNFSLLHGGQLLFVVARDYNATKGYLELYEDKTKVQEKIEVNLGRNGLAHGLGLYHFDQNSTDPIKHEGDGRGVVGLFELTHVFGYDVALNIHMPYLQATKELICVDESSSIYYNQIIHMPKEPPKSYELMRRDDEQYRAGVVVNHNGAHKSGRGSCIFLHVYKDKESPTSGCSAMSYEDMQKVVSWLDREKKPLLLQVTQRQKEEAIKLYPFLKKSELW